ncbi:radical SAM protein [Clostridium sp. 'deep sea']|uniref:radical SAM protein n=1 Tax=Clostridium sp. 'deep sea' TaxID=2779445 RepID=UPI001896421E|nr:radical SAM protein [Clostridium sp. 'deep sea']QOR35152.1 radical SAM protein [Clostridium sp. 'deep sea']
MDRYSVLQNREIVLLKSFPCFWGKCSFCDYINDNSFDKEKIINTNEEVLAKVTGVRGTLEVINSGSCFELPLQTHQLIKSLIYKLNIKKLCFESHWHYRNRLDEIRDYYDIPVMFKVGIETFDNNFRNKVLNKNAIFKNAEEVSRYFDSVCLLIGIKGQTKEMLTKDVELLLKYFNHGTINIFTENSTKHKRDEELINWFYEKYGYLAEYQNIDWLNINTDFGVGE